MSLVFLGDSKSRCDWNTRKEKNPIRWGSGWAGHRSNRSECLGNESGSYSKNNENPSKCVKQTGLPVSLVKHQSPFFQVHTYQEGQARTYKNEASGPLTSIIGDPDASPVTTHHSRSHAQGDIPVFDSPGVSVNSKYKQSNKLLHYLQYGKAVSVISTPKSRKVKQKHGYNSQGLVRKAVFQSFLVKRAAIEHLAESSPWLNGIYGKKKRDTVQKNRKSQQDFKIKISIIRNADPNVQ